MAREQTDARIAAILNEEFGLEYSQVRPLGRQQNNLTYAIDLPSPTQKTYVQKNPMPGTVAIPPGTQVLVVRMPHPDSGLETSTRIENEVAMMQLIRATLCLDGAQLVPDIYGWSDGGREGAWMVEEYKDGVDLHTSFSKLSESEKRTVLRQLALIVRALQRCELPETFHGYGGAGFDAKGNVISKAMSIGIGGPFASLTELYEEMLKAQLKNSDSSTLLQGWRPDDLRPRLDDFRCNGVAKLLSDAEGLRRTIVHGDIYVSLACGCLQNVVFDPQTLSVTGIFDFELSHVASPVEEFLYSFHDIGGILIGAYGEKADDLALRHAILYGFPNVLPTTIPNEESVYKFGSERHVQWDVAKLWDDELARAGVQRPRTLGTADMIPRLYWFSQEVCQFYVLQSRWLSSRTEDQLREERDKAKDVLDRYLNEWGF